MVGKTGYAARRCRQLLTAISFMFAGGGVAAVACHPCNPGVALGQAVDHLLHGRESLQDMPPPPPPPQRPGRTDTYMIWEGEGVYARYRRYPLPCAARASVRPSNRRWLSLEQDCRFHGGSHGRALTG